MRIPVTEPWTPAALLDELAQRAFAVLDGSPTGGRPEDAARDPWGYLERLLGVRPRMVERQSIKAVEGGRSFASTSRFTPLHTDSQLYDGGPPDVQVMACLHHDARGGDSTLLDAWSLLAQIEAHDRPLFEALFARPVLHPFVFGDVAGPTVALRGGALAFTHSPRFAEHEVGARLAPWLQRTPVTAVRVEAGQTLVVDNRRALHGREAFSDTRREFVRLLAWLPAPLSRHERYEQLARAQLARTEHAAASATGEARRRLGLAAPPAPDAEARWQIVLAMLRGAAPGVLAARHRIPEPTLYAWRDAAARAALDALASVNPAADEVALQEALRRQRG